MRAGPRGVRWVVASAAAALAIAPAAAPAAGQPPRRVLRTNVMSGLGALASDAADPRARLRRRRSFDSAIAPHEADTDATDRLEGS